MNQSFGNGGVSVIASYQYQGSTSTYGHVELGGRGATSTCTNPGTLVANGPNVTLHKYQQTYVSVPQTVNQNWAGTYYDAPIGQSTPKWGTVCSLF